MMQCATTYPLTPATETVYIDARLATLPPELLGTIYNGRALGAHLAAIALAVATAGLTARLT